MTNPPESTQFERALRSETVAYRDAVEVFERHRDRWQKTIVDAIDDGGMLIKDVAALVGVSTSRVHAVIARISSLPA